MAPHGTRIIAPDKPDARNLWAPHGKPGCYLGPAMENYHFHQVYINKTRATWISDTVKPPPYKFPMPHTPSADATAQAAQYIIHDMKNPAPAPPYNTKGTEQTAALCRLAEIFRIIQPRPTPAQTLRVIQDKAPPRVNIDNVAPPRVNTTTNP